MTHFREATSTSVSKATVIYRQNNSALLHKSLQLATRYVCPRVSTSRVIAGSFDAARCSLFNELLVPCQSRERAHEFAPIRGKRRVLEAYTTE